MDFLRASGDAWGFADQRDLAEAGVEDSPDLPDLLGHVLTRGVQRQIRRGLASDYTTRDEELSVLRGRVDVRVSARRQTWLSGRMHCQFQELTHETLPNRIVGETVRRLERCARLQTDIRERARTLLPYFAQCRPIELDRRLFRRVQLGPAAPDYRFLLNLCELLLDQQLPNQRPGGGLMQDLLDDDKRMHQVFEAFVRNFYAYRLPNWHVWAKPIAWAGLEAPAATLRLMPGMFTDVTMAEHGGPGRFIIDCKYYRDALKAGRYDALRFSTSNLYQLFAYLLNQRFEPGWEHVRGMLLYPAVAHHLDHCIRLSGHDIRIATVDLDQPWKRIEERLLELLA